ncbi:hypothetical protein Droror1_Dr00010602 [Drosera rotundifolia]
MITPPQNSKLNVKMTLQSMDVLFILTVLLELLALCFVNFFVSCFLFLPNDGEAHVEDLMERSEGFFLNVTVGLLRTESIFVNYEDEPLNTCLFPLSILFQPLFNSCVSFKTTVSTHAKTS